MLPGSHSFLAQRRNVAEKDGLEKVWKIKNLITRYGASTTAVAGKIFFRVISCV